MYMQINELKREEYFAGFEDENCVTDCKYKFILKFVGVSFRS